MPRPRPAMERLRRQGFDARARQLAEYFAYLDRPVGDPRELRKDRYESRMLEKLKEWGNREYTRAEKTYLTELVNEARNAQNRLTQTLKGEREQAAKKNQQTTYSAEVVIERTDPRTKQKSTTKIIVDKLVKVESLEIKRRFEEIRNDEIYGSDQIRFGRDVTNDPLTDLWIKNFWEE